MQTTPAHIKLPDFACAKHGLKPDCSCQRYNLSFEGERINCVYKRRSFRKQRQTRFAIAGLFLSGAIAGSLFALVYSLGDLDAVGYAAIILFFLLPAGLGGGHYFENRVRGDDERALDRVLDIEENTQLKFDLDGVEDSRSGEW